MITEEGTKYICKVASKNNLGFLLGALATPSPAVRINLPAIAPIPGLLQLNFTTAKKIIPISYMVSVIDSLNNIVADIQTPYYNFRKGLTFPVPAFDLNRAQGKIFPFAERIYLTDSNFYGIGVKYNDCIFNDSDFIDPTTGVVLQFVNSIAKSINHAQELVTIPSGTFDVGITFTYYEML